MEGTVLTCKSGMKKIVAPSVIKVGVIILVMCIQEMIYIMKVLESMKLKVEILMKVFSDNNGCS